MDQEYPDKLTFKEKLGFVGLVVFAVAVIYLGFAKLGMAIKTPSAIFASEHSAPSDETIQTDEQKMVDLQKKDTDRDGLSDYDELYVYNTSPYLVDSDSDGLDDKLEIEKGYDPNCPKGQICGVVEVVNPEAGVQNTATVEIPDFGMPTADQIVLQSFFGANPDPKNLREFLIRQGADKNVLDTFTDEELLNVYKEAATSPVVSTNNSTTQAGASLDSIVSSSTGAEGVNILDPQTLRQMLKDKGMSEADLSKIDDKTLLETVQEILSQQQ